MTPFGCYTAAILHMGKAKHGFLYKGAEAVDQRCPLVGLLALPSAPSLLKGMCLWAKT